MEKRGCFQRAFFVVWMLSVSLVAQDIAFSGVSFKESFFNEPTSKDSDFMFVGNIGGTNTRLGLIEMDGEEVGNLILLWEGASDDISDFGSVVGDLLDYLYEEYEYVVDVASFAVAGVISPNRDYCAITNQTWAVDAHEILEKSLLSYVSLLNDFEAIGYGVEALSKYDFICIQKGEESRETANKVVIGAGTGLGKCVLIWNPFTKGRFVSASEGGHADFPANSSREFRLMRFIRETEKINGPIEWEDVLSGRGIRRIYKFLLHEGVESPYKEKIIKRNYSSKVICAYRDKDLCCKKAIKMFIEFYGRCAKDFVLESLALGGIYLAGGIAQDEAKLFKKGPFLDAFHDNTKFKSLLQKVPVNIISNHNVELYGAAVWAQK